MSNTEDVFFVCAIIFCAIFFIVFLFVIAILPMIPLYKGKKIKSFDLKVPADYDDSDLVNQIRERSRPNLSFLRELNCEEYDLGKIMSKRLIPNEIYHVQIFEIKMSDDDEYRGENIKKYLVVFYDTRNTSVIIENAIPYAVRVYRYWGGDWSTIIFSRNNWMQTSGNLFYIWSFLAGLEIKRSNRA